jgi:hypothetical protein
MIVSVIYDWVVLIVSAESTLAVAPSPADAEGWVSISIRASALITVVGWISVERVSYRFILCFCV